MYECVMIPSERKNHHRIPNILKYLSSLFIFYETAYRKFCEDKLLNEDPPNLTATCPYNKGRGFKTFHGNEGLQIHTSFFKLMLKVRTEIGN